MVGAGPYEDFRRKVVRRFRRFDSDAENHVIVIGRNAALVRVLGYASMLYNAGKIPPGAKLVPNREGARWQSTAGSRDDRTKGAHCLPCQVMVVPSRSATGTDLSDLAPNQRLREGICSQFAHVTVLPTVFNSADIVAEQCCGRLRQACVTACRAVARGPRWPREHRLMAGEFRDVWRLNLGVVRGTYRTVWSLHSGRGYENALDEVEAGQLDLYLAPFGRQENPGLVMEVLNAYPKYHRSIEPSKLLDFQMDELEHEYNG